MFEPPPGLGGGGGGGCGGTPLQLLQLPATTLQAIGEASASCDPGMSTVRISAAADRDSSPLTASQAVYCQEVDSEVGLVCVKCRLAFPGEAGLLGHQRAVCYQGAAAESQRAVRLLQTHFECKLCSGSAEADKMTSLLDFKRHCESEVHVTRLGASPSGTAAPLQTKHAMQTPRLQPAQHQQQPAASLSPSAGLSHEMEDVVNQITLLAARAAAESTAPPQGPGAAPTDSNANIAGSKDNSDFCHPVGAKRNKLLQLHSGECSPVAVPSTGQ
jgi:hypothetical protein